MPKTTSTPMPQTTVTIAQVIVNATGFTATNPGTAPTNTVLVTTAGANDSVIKALMVSTDDSAKSVQFWASKDGGTTKHLIGTVTTAASGGSNGTAANLDVLGNTLFAGAEIDETGKAVIRLASGTTLYAGVLTAAMTTSKTLWITGTQLDY